MKLYEFSYTDKLNQTEAEVLVRVAEIVERECEQQGWAAGYSLSQCQTAERLSTGETRYLFEVFGAFSEGESDGTEAAGGPFSSGGSGVAAAGLPAER
jgi:hypothetical protein